MRTFFTQTTHWKNYDPFSKQKTDTFRSSRTAVLELAARYNNLTTELSSTSNQTGPDASKIESAQRILFHEMCKICLWGNATDLSLLTETSFADLQKLQGSAAIEAAEKNIVVNDLDRAFDALYASKTSGHRSDRRVDIVLDNAGFELFVDLLLAGYLLQSGLATQVVLHPKDIPWFVSDVTPRDFGDLLNIVANADAFYDSPSSSSSSGSEQQQQQQQHQYTPLTDTEKETLQTLAQNWMQTYASGAIVMRPNPYWTRATGFWDLAVAAPELYADLRDSSEMVIFKGDLNYRKLTCDVRCSLVLCSCLGGADHSSLRGRVRLLGRRRSVRWVTRTMDFVFWRSGRARLTLSSGCQRGWTRRSRSRTGARPTRRRRRGPGPASMLLCSSRMARLERSRP